MLPVNSLHDNSVVHITHLGSRGSRGSRFEFGVLRDRRGLERTEFALPDGTNCTARSTLISFQFGRQEKGLESNLTHQPGLRNGGK